MMPYAGEVRPRLGGSQFSAVSASVSNTTFSVRAPGSGHGGGGHSGAGAGRAGGRGGRVGRRGPGMDMGGGGPGPPGWGGGPGRRFGLGAGASLSKAGITCS